MAEPLSMRAQLLLQLAAEEASELGQDWLGTEHLLLGLSRLLDDQDVVAASVLRTRQVTRPVLRGQVMATFTANERSRKTSSDGGRPVMTPRSRYVLSRATSYASEMNSPSTSTGHILLGLLAEEDGVASSILRELGLTFGEVYVDISQDEGREEGSILGRSSPYSDAAVRISEIARQFAEDDQEERIGTNHILLALISEPSGAAARALSEFGIDIRLLVERLRHIRDED